MKRKWMFVLAPPMIVIFIVIGGEVVLHLWNWLLPALFGWRQISFWQAVGLLALFRILFGGFRRRGSGRFDFCRRIQERCGRTPEEREKFRQSMREGWGFGPPASESKAQGSI